MNDLVSEPTSIKLPRRPRLLPGLDVLERGPGEVQIGLDPRHAVVAAGLTPGVITALRGLDGKRSIDSVLLLAESEHGEQLRELLTEMTARGLLTEADPPRHSARPGAETGLWSLRARHYQQALQERRKHSSVAVHGDGRLAVAVAVLLANAGIGHLDIKASGTVTEQDLGSGYTDAELGMPRRAAIIQAVHRIGPETVTTRIFGAHRPELVLLTDAVVPAPELVSELVTDGIAHLPVRVRDGTGIVGPLVVPGRSSCLRCADLHRTSLDSCWPRVASQLAGRAQRPDLGAVQSCAALATAQVLRLLSPDELPPPAWNATLEIDSYDGAVRHREWLPHPGCGCGAR
ncbi:ThiF family adenylyltransferase [Amycolatopsis sp. H20-H5]|uniref:ThiF family adenylyltransferase n=1 Tax=Amycolatopsis sp. H20-H5 TaxID=3046309 RepID=UPI002DB77E7F|nr:ThiF family adenylyltransferase [Amycolatopsis sp. H20-H5]MEC3978970.1 ThiF family adenylyltransferase [Amycolatopsis sp. H20-H5]